MGCVIHSWEYSSDHQHEQPGKCCKRQLHTRLDTWADEQAVVSTEGQEEIPSCSQAEE